MMYVKERRAPSTCPTAPAFLPMKSPYMFNHLGGSLTMTFVWSTAWRTCSMAAGPLEVCEGAVEDGVVCACDSESRKKT